MSILLVRHGKAAPISQGGDYDHLSELGHEQATALGEHWLKMGVSPTTVYVGPRRRHLRTAEMVREVFTRHGRSFPMFETMPELDEHDGINLVTKVLPTLGLHPMPEGGNIPVSVLLDHFKSVTRAWVRGEVTGEGVESWPDFRARATQARVKLQEAGHGGVVAAFTSAGTVAAIVSDVLGVASEGTALELSWSLQNGSVSSIGPCAVGWMLRTFNETAHLADPRLLTHV